MPHLEKIWIAIGVATMAAFFVTLITLAVASDLNPPSTEGMTIDPTRVMQSPPFDKPGLHQIGPHLYEAYYVGQVFQWSPHDLTVPAGSTVRFYVTSTDVVHGFTIPTADVNLEVMPGWISEVDHTFRTAGDYLILCNQYCGAGHANMFSRVEVTP